MIQRRNNFFFFFFFLKGDNTTVDHQVNGACIILSYSLFFIIMIIAIVSGFLCNCYIMTHIQDTLSLRERLECIKTNKQTNETREPPEIKHGPFSVKSQQRHWALKKRHHCSNWIAWQEKKKVLEYCWKSKNEIVIVRRDVTNTRRGDQVTTGELFFFYLFFRLSWEQMKYTHLHVTIATPTTGKKFLR